MKTSINLIPPELTPDEKIVKIGATAKKISVFGFSLYLILGISGGSLIYILKNQVNSNHQIIAEVKANIQALAATEQKIILLKDRLTKVNDVKVEADKEDNLLKFERVMSLIPEGALLTEGSFGKGVAEASFLVSDSSSLKNLMNSLTTLDIYKQIIMTGFSFNPTLGYSISVKMQ